jgi:hypothetical protein
MDTYVVPGDNRGKAARPRLGSVAATFGTVRHPEPAPRETNERVRLRVEVAVAVVATLALWALVWFALSRLLTNSP